jgi:lysophospholipase L1-like esterase
VLNRGICSDTTVGLLKRLEKNVNNIEINKLFILIGYNDLPYRSNEEILANIEMVVNEVRARNIYVQSLLPVEAKRKDINHRIKDINNRLKKICESKKVEYVDLHSHFIDASGGLSNSYSLDGIHLNGDGYRLWKELIEKRIK